jgi:dihydrodipicolinate reductase
MIRIGISGAAGRMGTAIAALVEKEKEMKLKLALEGAGNKMIGNTVAGCRVTDDLKRVLMTLMFLLIFPRRNPRLKL